MRTLRIRHRIMLVVGLAVTCGLVGTGIFYTKHQQDAVLAQNERTMRKLTESVIQGLQSIMLAGSAEIAQSYADRLKKVPDIADFRILRVSGDEAFRDNLTIHEVNERRGDTTFQPRTREERVAVLAADDPNLKRALTDKQPFAVYENRSDGARMLTFIAPIENLNVCHKCHGKSNPVRGVIKLTSSLVSVDQDIARVRWQSLAVIASALAGIMLLTGYMMRRTVVAPIERVTAAMARVANGDLEHKVPIDGTDELGNMAHSFNRMTGELRLTYEGLRKEKNKLATIIFGAGEGIVVTDSEGTIVLVNPAAEELLHKEARQIIDDGFEQLVDDPRIIRDGMTDGDEPPTPLTIGYGTRTLKIYASTIRAEDGHVVGKAALLRDVSAEKRLEEELRTLSTTDALTGLYNRRFLDEALAAEFHRTLRTHGSLSVVMVDVDHFKSFNDRHGHEQGDRVLQDVARTMRHGLRKYDLACRYGGEEFTAILPNTGIADAMMIAERLRSDVEAMLVDGLAVTISLGVATYPIVAADTAGELVEAADRALYASKKAGRNRCTPAPPEI